MSRNAILGSVAFAFIAWNFVACLTSFAYPGENRNDVRDIRRLQRLTTGPPPFGPSYRPATAAAGNASGGGGENISDEAKHLKQLEGSGTQTQGNTAMLEMEADKCDIYDPVCDRRFKPNSCESRIPVEAEGVCSSSWAFSMAHAYAISQCMQTGEAVQFSKQELIDCSQSGCQGGQDTSVLRYIDKSHHWTTEKDYPFEYRKGKCRAHGKPNALKLFPDTSASLSDITSKQKFKSEESWTNEIKALLVKHGAVVIYIDASTFKDKGATPIENCQVLSYDNQLMLLTGWKINKADKRPVWIMRSSWGLDWGENGYGYLYMDTKCPKKDQSNFHLISYPRYIEVLKRPLKPSIREKRAVYTRYFNVATWPQLGFEAISCATPIWNSESLFRSGRDPPFPSNTTKALRVVSATYEDPEDYFNNCHYTSTRKFKNLCDGKPVCELDLAKHINKKRCAKQLTLKYTCIERGDCQNRGTNVEREQDDDDVITEGEDDVEEEK